MVALAALLAGCWPGPQVGPPINPSTSGGRGGGSAAGGGSAVGGGSAAGGGSATVPVLTFRELQDQVLTQSCAESMCHTGNPPAFAPMSLDADLSWNALMQPSTQEPTLRRVVPGHPEQSYLYMKLLGTTSGSSMPLNRELLPADHLEQVRVWIERGALND
jgi:hypothetical protein